MSLFWILKEKEVVERTLALKWIYSWFSPINGKVCQGPLCHLFFFTFLKMKIKEEGMCKKNKWHSGPWPWSEFIGVFHQLKEKYSKDHCGTSFFCRFKKRDIKQRELCKKNKWHSGPWPWSEFIAVFDQLREKYAKDHCATWFFFTFLNMNIKQRGMCKKNKWHSGPWPWTEFIAVFHLLKGDKHLETGFSYLCLRIRWVYSVKAVCYTVYGLRS